MNKQWIVTVVSAEDGHSDGDVGDVIGLTEVYCPPRIWIIFIGA